MTRKITAAMVRTQFGQIMERAIEHHDRFLVERNGEPAVLILSVSGYVAAMAPAPDWLKDIQAEAKSKGLDTLAKSDIDAEIADVSRARRAGLHQQRT